MDSTLTRSSFTDQGQTGVTDPTGRVYRLSPNGKLDCLLSNGNSPNGLVLSIDEKVLFVAMTRANQVSSDEYKPYCETDLVIMIAF